MGPKRLSGTGVEVFCHISVSLKMVSGTHSDGLCPLEAF